MLSSFFQRPKRCFNLVVVTTFGLLSACSAGAATVAQWNFNSVPSDTLTTTGTLSPTIDLVPGVPLITNVGNPVPTGQTNPNAAFFNATTTSTISLPLDNSSDPATSDDSSFGIRYTPLDGTLNKTAGIQIQFSTIGLTGVDLTYDQKTARFASRYWQVQYSLNGSDFTDFGAVYEPLAVDRFQVNVTGPVGVNFNQWNNGKSASFGSLLDNQPTAFVRIVAAFDPNTGNTYAGNLGNDGAASSYFSTNVAQFDMVTVTAIPEPASFALIGASMLLLARRRRA